MNTITVLLADDHAILREGLRALLKLEDTIQVVGEAENGREAVALAIELSPDVVVMDIAMPLLNGMEATRQIHAASPATKVLILSSHGDDAYIERAMALGAAGYLVKQTSALILPEAIRRVQQSKQFFSPEILTRFKDRTRKAQIRDELMGKETGTVTAREMEILQLIAEGKANKEMAADLNLSVKTIEKHRQSLMNKLDIHSIAGLTRYAIATGVIENNLPMSFA